MDELELAELLRDALLHLHEPRYLQSHPLAALLVGEASLKSRGLALRVHLLTLIERLRPPDDTPAHALAWRSHRYVKRRYVDSLEHSQVSSELGITDRHAQRVRHEALDALVKLITPSGPAQEVRGASRSDSGVGLLECELSRVDTTLDPPVRLRELTRAVAETLAALADEAGTSIHLVDDPGGDALVDRTTARLVSLNLLSYAISQRPSHPIRLSTRVSPPRIEISFTLPRSVAHGDAGARDGIRNRKLNGASDETSSLAVEVAPNRAREEASGAASEDHQETDEHLQTARRIAGLRGASVGVERVGPEYRLVFVLTDLTPRPRRVLLIDDNPDFLLLYQRYLESTGFDVVTASDVGEALRIAQESPPNVITLDVIMPHQDGWEALQRLKHHNRTRDVPVIVCSVLHDEDLAFSLGASGFLPKPVNQAALLRAIERACLGRPTELSGGSDGERNPRQPRSGRS